MPKNPFENWFSKKEGESKKPEETIYISAEELAHGLVELEMILRMNQAHIDTLNDQPKESRDFMENLIPQTSRGSIDSQNKAIRELLESLKRQVPKQMNENAKVSITKEQAQLWLDSINYRLQSLNIPLPDDLRELVGNKPIEGEAPRLESLKIILDEIIRVK